jgi:hypothetical protein
MYVGCLASKSIALNFVGEIPYIHNASPVRLWHFHKDHKQTVTLIYFYGSIQLQAPDSLAAPRGKGN